MDKIKRKAAETSATKVLTTPNGVGGNWRTWLACLATAALVGGLVWVAVLFCFDVRRLEVKVRQLERRWQVDEQRLPDYLEQRLNTLVEQVRLEGTQLNW